MENTTLNTLADAVLQRCDALAACSEEPGRLTRTFLRPPMRRVHALLGEWMREAGLTVRIDAIGNLIGRRPGRSERVFVIGSHVDTVPNGGKYDGVLGVLLGIAAMQALSGRSFARTVDVIAFSEEEGVRFRTPYLGSRAVCGQFDSALLELTDADGKTLTQAVRDFGLDPAAIPDAAYSSGQLAGYFEAHIEQGPVLESRGLALGVVSAIAGQSRFALGFTGQAGHAGTQPMDLRRDALTAAAEFVVAVERAAQARDGLRATVGSLTVAPGAVNVVPGEVRLTLDVRHVFDTVRSRSVEELLLQAKSICEPRQIVLSVEPLLDEPAVECDPAMTARLLTAVATSDLGAMPTALRGHEACLPKAASMAPGVHTIVSGAGHDAVVMATRCPVAMLFLRSPGGISHHPDESVRREDVHAALDAMIQFLEIELDLE